MPNGFALADATLVRTGVLALNVITDAPRERYTLELADCPAARCIERDDSVAWRNDTALWSNRTRTVRDVPIQLVSAALSPQEKPVKGAAKSQKKGNWEDEGEDWKDQ